MNKKYYLCFNIIVLILLFTGCKEIKDEVTDTSFKVNLEEASELYIKETKNNEVLEIKFDIPNNFDTYGYIFKNKEEDIYINAMDGKLSKLSAEDNSKYQETFKLKDIKTVDPIKPLLESAKKEVGGLAPRILSWSLYYDNRELIYNIDVKTTTSDKEVIRKAIQ